jgi:DNA-binding transcriptional LysR family regulator
MPHVLEQSVYFEIFDACAGAGFRPRFTPNLRQDAPDLQSALPLVAAGLGITLVPDSWQAVSLRGLVYRRLAPPAPAIELVILRGAGQPSPVLSTFLNVTNQQLARLRRPH